MKNNDEWFLVIDASRARVFRREKRNARPDLMEEIDHPEGRLRTSELVGDRPGRKDGGKSGHTAVPQKSDPADVVQQRFAKQIAAHVDQAAQKNRFGRLHVLAPPGLLGLLRPQWSKPVKDKLGQEFTLDLAHSTEAQVVDRLVALET